MNILKIKCMALLVLALVCSGPCQEGLTAEGKLDKPRISDWYFNGEFAKVQDVLERYRKAHANTLDEQELVFIYKHLSVVYAAKPDAREKAESYMYQLLKLKPTIELLDLYVSDSIESIFSNVKKKYQAHMAYLQRQEEEEKSKVKAVEKDQTVTEPQGADTTAASPSKKSHKWVWWSLGGSAVVAAVVAFILLSGEDDAPSENQAGDI